MSPVDERPDASAADIGTAARLSALERQVAELRAEVAQLRASAARGEPVRVPPGVEALRLPPRPTTNRSASSSGTRDPFTWARGAVRAASGGLELEAAVGRYGTLILAALVILMGVGVLIRVAVSRGLLTPEVRVAMGALAAAAVGAAGVHFHRRGEVRFGNVLLALSLAVVDLVAWGAGPQLQLVPTSVALLIVDIVAIALAALALHDGSEFLFSIAVAGALSSPFVTTDGHGSAPALLAYGALVIVGSLRAVSDPRWIRAFGVLVAGAFVYALTAAAMSTGTAWYSPFAVVLFGAACALGALSIGERAWRGSLARAFLAVGVIGVPDGWDRMVAGDWRVAAVVALVVAAVTYAALLVRRPRQPLWMASALGLPLVSLAIASAATGGREPGQGVVFAIWAAMALGAWQFERLRSERRRGGAHLMVGGVLGSIAVALLLWPMPLALVAGLAAWGVVLATLVEDETTELPLIGVAVASGGAALSALDQLASRQAYAYVPFMTRSSASALVATLGIAAAGWVLARGRGAPAQWADRAVRLGALIGFVVLWGRMEVAEAFSRDLATFLLIAYYAACGVVSIVIGRRLSIQRLRVGGLVLAIYAALKAVMHASDISGILLRVAAYGAVGVFLLGAGYGYRERKDN
ncbi:MAG TPA: DUF2339 domain-containing protein [Gemmatimonadaceae bacterium]|nr:DUF2339 domain-containing protein [Gemmatimonadaceae bacterium]